MSGSELRETQKRCDEGVLLRKETIDIFDMFDMPDLCSYGLNYRKLGKDMMSCDKLRHKNIETGIAFL